MRLAAFRFWTGACAHLQTFARSRQGGVAAEYALILALAAGAVTIAALQFSTALSSAINRDATSLAATGAEAGSVSGSGGPPVSSIPTPANGSPASGNPTPGTPPANSNAGGNNPAGNPPANSNAGGNSNPGAPDQSNAGGKKG